jgi:transketolase
MERKEGLIWTELEKIFSSFQTDISLRFTALRSGYFPVSELATFRLINSRLQGHPLDGLPGVRIASGSLGQGMSVGIGAAQAKNKQ